MQAEETIRKHLRKSFRTAEQQITILKDTTQECHSLVDSLANLAEQLQCCRKAATDHEGVLLLTTYPDLHGRLEVKLVQSMERIMGKLQGHMDTLQSARNKLYYQYTHTLSAYQKHSSEFSLGRATQRTATWPSVADMLQWLADIDRHYAYICAERQWMLDTISYESLDSMRTLPKKWKLENSEINQFQDILAQVSFFMTAK